MFFPAPRRRQGTTGYSIACSYLRRQFRYQMSAIRYHILDIRYHVPVIGYQESCILYQLTDTVNGNSEHGKKEHSSINQKNLSTKNPSRKNIPKANPFSMILPARCFCVKHRMCDTSGVSRSEPTCRLEHSLCVSSFAGGKR